MLFTARNLNKGYAAGTAGCSVTARVLRALNLELDAAQVVGVVGPRGAGKTTLMRCVAGLARPDAGALHWHESANRPRIVALAPAAYPFETVCDVVGRASGDPAVDPDSLVAILSDLSLTGRLAAEQASLTTDERARLALAIGLATRHPLLLLDGTPDALAARARPLVRCLLERHASSGGAVLLAGRDSEAVLALASPVHALRDGCLRPWGNVEGRQAPPRVAERGVAPLIR
jgi:ABC-type transport system involved in cytochrome c biogenesis ATPase subunit